MGRERGHCWEGWGTIQEQVLEVVGLVRLRMDWKLLGVGVAGEGARDKRWVGPFHPEKGRLSAGPSLWAGNPQPAPGHWGRERGRGWAWSSGPLRREALGVNAWPVRMGQRQGRQGSRCRHSGVGPVLGGSSLSAYLGARVSAAQSPWGERSSFIQGVGGGGTGASHLPKGPGPSALGHPWSPRHTPGPCGS